MRETQLSVDDLIYPLPVMEGEEQQVEIVSMPGCSGYSLDLLLKEVVAAFELGINVIALFPVILEVKKIPLAANSFQSDRPFDVHKFEKFLTEHLAQILGLEAKPKDEITTAANGLDEAEIAVLIQQRQDARHLQLCGS